jgi:hypothetical protein
MIRQLAYIFCSVMATSAMASTSVWDEARTQANEVMGKVVSMTADTDEVLVRITDGQNHTETYRVCSTYPGGDGLNVAEQQRMQSLRDAFNQGQTVRVSYNSPFDRCIGRVEINKDDVLKEKTHAEISKAEHSRKSSRLN